MKIFIIVILENQVMEQVAKKGCIMTVTRGIQGRNSHLLENDSLELITSSGYYL